MGNYFLLGKVYKNQTLCQYPSLVCIQTQTLHMQKKSIPNIFQRAQKENETRNERQAVNKPHRTSANSNSMFITEKENE